MTLKHTKTIYLMCSLSICKLFGRIQDSYYSSVLSQIHHTLLSFISPMSNGQQANYLVAKPNEEQTKKIQEAIKLTNAICAKEGLPALKYDESLSAYAQMRATELAQNFSHIRPNVEQAYGYIYGSKAWTLENIVVGVSTASGAIKLWENSQGYRWAMTNKSNKTIGIGLVYIPNSKYGYYWVQMFGYEGALAPFTFNNTKPLQQVIVNGVTLTIPQKQGVWQTIQENGYTAEVNGYKVCVLEWLRNHTRDVNVFYQALQTHERAMPTTGSRISRTSSHDAKWSNEYECQCEF